MKRNSLGRFVKDDKQQYHKGYKVVYCPGHPHARQNGYVYEHILVMEKMLGRYLTNDEVVHHKDNNKLNNSEYNLELFNNNSEHLRHHWKTRSKRYDLNDGKSATIQELAELASIPYERAYQRINKLGWTADDVINGYKRKDDTQ